MQTWRLMICPQTNVVIICRLQKKMQVNIRFLIWTTLRIVFYNC